MPVVTLSSKHQITLPAGIVRTLGLRPGAKLVVELLDDHLILLPQPESWAEYFRGSMKGVYGSTAEEIDRYISEVRYGWDIDALKDALAVDADLRAVYEATPSLQDLRPSEEALPSWEIAKRAHLDDSRAWEKLVQLQGLHAVKALEHPTKKAGPVWIRT